MVNKKPINKSLIILKSTVFSMGFILAIMLILLIILKSRKDDNLNTVTCDNHILSVNNKIEQFTVRGNRILLLTKPYIEDKTKSQDLIEIKSDDSCQKLISKTKLIISNN